jgi:hypothetical protein
MTDYADYLVENLNKNISHSKYIIGSLDNTISYSEYIADKLDKSIIYGDYINDYSSLNDRLDKIIEELDDEEQC